MIVSNLPINAAATPLLRRCYGAATALKIAGQLCGLKKYPLE
jgi:hypothetical protein